MLKHVSWTMLAVLTREQKAISMTLQKELEAEMCCCC